MRNDSIAKGAGFGRDANPRKPGLINFGFTLEHGSRAQRRETLRQLQQFRRQGVPGAATALNAAQQRLDERTAWVKRIPAPSTQLEINTHA